MKPSLGMVQKKKAFAFSEFKVMKCFGNLFLNVRVLMKAINSFLKKSSDLKRSLFSVTIRIKHYIFFITT